MEASLRALSYAPSLTSSSELSTWVFSFFKQKTNFLENSAKNPNPTAYGAFIASYVHTNLKGGSEEIKDL